MIQIKTMNAISPVYEEILNPSAYAVGPEEAAPQAILVRSADLHASEFRIPFCAWPGRGRGIITCPSTFTPRRAWWPSIPPAPTPTPLRN